MKRLLTFSLCLMLSIKGICWGFYAHQLINRFAVFLLPPEMMVFYKPNIQFLTDHAVDPDKRRYIIASEAPKHYIDIDHYGSYPFSQLPRNYDNAVEKFSEDTITANGVAPWWILRVQAQLTDAFKEKNGAKVLKLSAEIGHYIADCHVPLHTSSNHDGQLSNQRGIHAFWESRIPELLAEKDFDFMIGKAEYVSNLQQYTWNRVLESAAEADTVLTAEAELTKKLAADRKFSFEERNGKVIKQYSTEFTIRYNATLKGMVERRMRMAIASAASFWYTAWVNAGQPDLKALTNNVFTEADLRDFDALNAAWKSGAAKGRPHE